MNISVKFIGLILILLTTTTFVPNYKYKTNSIFFPIKQISVEGTKVLNNKDILLNLDYLKGTSIFFINEEGIKDILKKHRFIESFKVKKIYPNTIKFVFTEKEPIAINSQGVKKFYITTNGEYIKFEPIDSLSELPVIFGKKNNFDLLYKGLKDINFPINKVKSYLSFDIGRWDIILKNDTIIKLSDKDPLKGVKNYMLIYNKKEFNMYKVFDYRIKNQLILK